MTELNNIAIEEEHKTGPHAWMGLVLDNFAKGEQAVGRLSSALGLPIANGSLGSLKELRNRLSSSDNPAARALEKRIARWIKNRPYRHLLAHATITTLYDAGGHPVLVTRHLPLDETDVTPDRIWSLEEQNELLRQASNDGRSICDHVRNLLSDPVALRALSKA